MCSKTVYYILQLKTTQPDGVILYSGTATGRDFLAVELFDGHVRYVYDVGGGARTLRVNLRYSVSDNRWHRVAIVRSTLTQVSSLIYTVLYTLCFFLCFSLACLSASTIRPIRNVTPFSFSWDPVGDWPHIPNLPLFKILH